MSIAAIDPARLLVAEDDPEQRTLLRVALEEEGYRVTTASSLPASLEALEEQLFHFVLTDLFRQSGQPFLQNVQPLLAQAAPTPVGVLTGWQVPEAAVMQAGASFLMYKPFDLDDLIHAIRHALAPRPAFNQTQLVRAFFAALGQHDWLRLQQVCTPDLVVVSIIASPAEATRRGLWSNLALLEKRLFALPETTIEEVQIFARPTGLAARYLICWQPRNGKAHRMVGALSFRFRGERISEVVGAF